MQQGDVFSGADSVAINTGVESSAKAAVVLRARLVAAQRQLETARRETEVQKQARASDTARMAWRLSRAQQEQAAEATHASSHRGTLAKQRDLWRAAAIAGIVALGVLCAVGWRMAGRTVAPVILIKPVTGAKAGEAPQPAIQHDVHTDLAQSQAHNSAEPQGSLTLGLNHLNSALNSALAAAPGDSAEEILRKVSASGRGCKIVWIGDYPSMLFTGKSLASTLEDCAKAVAALH